MRGQRRFGIAMLIGCAMLAVPASVGAASADFGATASSDPTNFASAGTGVQDSIHPGGPSYASPFGGVITSWRTRADASGGPVELKVFRRTATAGEFLTVGESGERTGSPNQENSFATGIPVAAGDLLGLRWSNNYRVSRGTLDVRDFFRYTSFADPAPDSLFTPALQEFGFLNVSATVETDNDLDGLGDDTQDVDDDNDGVVDDSDNCPLAPNPFQENSDGAPDGADACDPDDDDDGVPDGSDNCRLVANPGQENTDGDAEGDACDADDDNDGLSDDSERALGTDPLAADTDGDGKSDAADSCPKLPSAAADGCPVLSGALTPPALSPDFDAPALTVGRVPRRMTRRRFLRRLVVRFRTDEPSTMKAKLRGSARRAKLARSFNVVLARKALPLGAGARSVRLKPRRRLVGRARRFRARLVLTVEDASGNRTTKRRSIRVR